MSTTANSLIYATAEHLARHAPFDHMEREHLLWLARRLKLSYYAKGEMILSPEQGVVDRFFIIKQGVVLGEQDVVRAQDDSAWLELHEGECFPLGALLSKRAVSSTYRARDDVFCYELAAADFHELTHLSAHFHDFCSRRIAMLLEQSKHVIQAQYSQSSSEQQSMSSPLSAIVRRAPVTCAPETPIREVLQTMHDLGIGSMVAAQDGRPLGIFTLHDVLNRVALANVDLARPIIGIMSTHLTTLPPQALAYEAALAMAKHGIRHVLVCDNGKLAGVISEKDLFTLQRVSLRQVSTSIRGAVDVPGLKQCAHDIRQLARNMLAQGVAAEQLTLFISTLNDLLTSRVIELECEAQGISHSALCDMGICWLALGSEGRFEQTLSTDQDNGIIFALPPHTTADEIRQKLLPLAQRINHALDACGFPLCKGGIMASNPKWCLSLDEWKAAFSAWIDHGDPDALLNATIFFDFRPLLGNATLADELKDWLVDAAEANPRFLHQMAANALRNRPPLGVVRDFVVDDGTLDLKMNGVAPFVDGARIFALATGGPATNTAQRLRGAAAKLNIPAGEIEAWIEAFYFIQLLRLRHQHGLEEDEAEVFGKANRIDPDQLNPLDRRILKEAFRQARKLQARLALDYQL